MKPRSTLFAVVVPLFLIGMLGCDGFAHQTSTTVKPTAAAVRAKRRLYDGAPPVIPHPALKINCTNCHTETGKESPPLGYAPANPHGMTSGIAGIRNCQQCHVFRRDEGEFAGSDFVGLAQNFTKADRLFPGAPPVIPHAVFMRENCNSCHSGPVARKEIRCSHSLRSNCRQCHVPQSGASDAPSLSSL